jgi:hypothetical protein
MGRGSPTGFDLDIGAAIVSRSPWSVDAEASNLMNSPHSQGVAAALVYRVTAFWLVDAVGWAPDVMTRTSTRPTAPRDLGLTG